LATTSRRSLRRRRSRAGGRGRPWAGAGRVGADV